MFGISYWILPLFAGTVWLGTLAGMLGYWLNAGSPHYPEMSPNQHIAYISDLGATFLKPLFITGSTVMVVVFDVTFIIERWLRHKNRLMPNYTRKEGYLSVCAIIASIVGALGLILLTIFDIRHYDHVHDAMLGVFILGYVVSAIFICAEYQRLGIHYRQYQVLRISFWVKLAFIFIEVALVIGFGVCSKYRAYNAAAILEWIVSLIYIFYVWSFVLDFIPATHSKRPENRYPDVRDPEHPARADPEIQQHGGKITALPISAGGGHHGMDQPEMTYQPPQASRNF